MADTNETPNCNMHEALVSYLYNEASPDEMRQVESHIKQCRACSQELAAFHKVRDMLQQWQLEELPAATFATGIKGLIESRRPFLVVLKELLAIAPLWAKAAGAVAAAMVLLAVLGTQISVGTGGISLRADLFRRSDEAVQMDRVRLEQVRAELGTVVNAMIAESERQQSEALKAHLVILESQLQNAHAADLAKLAARIEQQRMLIKALERDIDRREGLDLTDILFSEVTGKAGEQGGGSTSGY